MSAAILTPEVFEARLAGDLPRVDGVSIAQLEAEGWTRGSDPSPWGSVWMVRPVESEEQR